VAEAIALSLEAAARRAGEPRMTRRRFLAASAAASLALPLAACTGSEQGRSTATAAPAPSSSDAAATADRVDVAVVGGGLAGLTAAYRLRRGGVGAVVYEASERLGGRCFTCRGFFADGQTSEQGGQRIAPSHGSIRSLIEELGLELADAEAAERGDAYLVEMDGRRLSEDEAYAGYGTFLFAVQELAARAGMDFTPRGASRLARELDARSAEDVLAELVDGGLSTPLGRSLELWLTLEFGLDARELSGLAVLENFADMLAGEFRYEVAGGNDLIVTRLAGEIGEAAISRATPLIGLAEASDGYRLRFGGRSRDVVARRVVLALPFTTLRHVDLTGVPLPADKLRAIQELGMGTNAKLHLGLDSRVQSIAAGWSGRFDCHSLRADGWSSTPHQRGSGDVLVIYTGGRSGAAYETAVPHGPAPQVAVDRALAALHPLAERLPAAYDGQAWLNSWIDEPWARGSYSAYLPGQVTTLLGVGARRERGLVFAGEHTSTVSQGFLDGAVESGERAARELLEA
jgi:monoamine oxidase